MLKERLPALLNEIRQRLELMESRLPKRVDAMAVSRISKVPYKVLFYREALIWRMAELSRTAFEDFQREKLASAMVVTRAAVETSAALWYLCAKVSGVVESGSLENVDYLMSMVVGVATDPPPLPDGSVFPRPIKIKYFLKQVEKDIPGFSRQYGMLSEYAHPNWAGTVLLYAKHDAGKRVTDFGQNIRKGDATRGIGIVNLSVALAMFERSYDRVGELLPAFTALCEKSLNDKQGV